MALTTTYSRVARDAKVNALLALLQQGTIEINDGVQPNRESGATVQGQVLVQ